MSGWPSRMRAWRMRWDSSRNWTSLPWRTMRPIAAAAIRSPPNTDLHLPNPRFAAITTDCVS